MASMRGHHRRTPTETIRNGPSRDTSITPADASGTPESSADRRQSLVLYLRARAALTMRMARIAATSANATIASAQKTMVKKLSVFCFFWKS